jgi:hypothetical protein
MLCLATVYSLTFGVLVYSTLLWAHCESAPFVQWHGGGGGGETTVCSFACPSRFCLSTILYTFTQRKCLKHIAVIKGIIGSDLCLLTALCILRMLFCWRRPSSMGVYIYFTFVVEYCASEIPSHYSIGRIFCFVLFTRVNDGCVVFILILHYRHPYCIALNENGSKKWLF